MSKYISLKDTPPALWVLVSLKMWESFSYYGMQALLVLYLTQSLGYTDHRALGLYAIYAALVELASVYGGNIGDRFGYLKSVALGSTLIVLGHTGLAIPMLPIFWGLGLIVVGTGLFRPNTTALLGNIYSNAEADLRESGFTLFYAALNLGGFLAGCVCGFVGETFGWHFGFGLAALGMGIGWLIFYQYKHLLLTHVTPKSPPPIFTTGSTLALGIIGVIALLYFHEEAFLIVPLMLGGCLLYVVFQLRDSLPEERRLMSIIGFFTLLLALFFAIEEQIGSTLVLFASRHVDRQILGVSIPASSLIAINPFVIIFGGFLLSKRRMSGTLQFSLIKVMSAFAIQLLAFGWLYLMCHLSMTANDVPVAAIGVALMLIGISELFIGPTVWAVCAQLSPRRFQGTLIGLVMLGYALGNLISGFLSRLMAVEESEGKLSSLQASLEIYQHGFLILCGMGMGTIIFTFICRKFMGVVVK